MIKWTEKDALRCLQNLTNPFEKKGIGQPELGQKPRLADVLNNLRNNGGGANPPQESVY